MKLNGVEINISSYTSETMSSEMVLFNEEAKKIIHLNQAAMLIWKVITENFQKNIDICTGDILNEFMKLYSIFEAEKSIVYSDIDETIELLFQSSFIEPLKY